MSRKVVIIHGWSDSSEGMRNLAERLSRSRKLDAPVEDIYLADYISLVDAVTFDDLVLAMDRAWDERKLPREPYSVNAVVHSTGGLVIRDWLDKKCPGGPPIKNLVMLAPANFGSPLAHLGASVLGRIKKGVGSQRFLEVGEILLKGLELASPYTWDLALRDRFAPNPYDVGKVLCTVLVGNSGYGGLASLANKPGSDGTVRASTANMNCVLLRADFSKNPRRPAWNFEPSRGMTAFAIMDGENHSTICGKKGGFANGSTFGFILDGLLVKDAEFAKHCERLDKHTKAVMPFGSSQKDRRCFQSLDVYVEDDLGHPVRDYVMEFYDQDEDENWLTRMFNEDVLTKVHVYGDDSAFRNFLFNVTELHRSIDKERDSLNVSLSAYPDIEENKFVGYRTFGEDDLSPMKLGPKAVQTMFQPHRTLMAHLILQREVVKRVFQFKDM